MLCVFLGGTKARQVLLFAVVMFLTRDLVKKSLVWKPYNSDPITKTQYTDV